VTRRDTVVQALTAKGMSDRHAGEKAALFELIDTGLGPARNAPGSLSIFVPGRIEFLGKHTDYAGGRSLVCAVERGICLTAIPRNDRRVGLHDVVRGLHKDFDLGPELAPAVGSWDSYGMVVARRIARNFPDHLRGADIYFASDLTPAAGMSTSSALVTGFFHLLARLNELEDNPVWRSQVPSLPARAEYLGSVENGSSFRTLSGDTGVGTSGGSEDHAAILLSEANRLLLAGFSPVRIEDSVPLPSQCVFVIAVSGVVAEKVGAARGRYNRIARATTRILHYWNQATRRRDPTLMAAISSSPEAHLELREVLESSEDPEFEQGTLLARLEQFVMETTVLIPDAVEALNRDEMAGIGAVVDLSQLLAERMLENQVPETVTLARLARERGAVAASAFGAGFGGSVYALVERAGADEFREAWSTAYLAGFPGREGQAEFFVTGAGPSLTVI
jgi:galactokinase